ncbi:hypothetical protein [Mesorhizobium sp. M1405]|uniref:hypothetical protein n=1 Tax=Mesorhizobium sp. M1405 TaxID=2957098 RepID=UPI003337B387
MSGLLPHVDRDALIIEEDPEMLDAYALGLWQQWQALEGQGNEAPAKRYSKETVKAAVVWLTGAYVEAEAPIPYELSRLVRAIIAPKKAASTSPVRASSEKAYWAAIRFEATYPASARAPLYAVAKHLCDTGALLNKNASQKTAEATVKSWRKLGHYQANVQLNRPMEYKAKPNSTP